MIWDMHFDLADLRLFIHIAESPSLTQGARRAHLSLAAVSTRIKTLEAQLNTRLLYRDSRGVELTPAGHRLLQHARVILRQVEHLKHDFAAQSDSDAGHIRIFANTTAVTQFMPAILARFLAERPGVTIDLQERLTRDIVRGVMDGSTDLGIVAGPVDAPGLQAIHFSTDRLVLAVPPGHPLAERASVKLTEAVQYPFIGMHEGSTLVAFLREQVERSGARLPLRIQLYSFDAILGMVQAGVGVGVIPDSAAQRYNARDKIRVVELDEPWVLRERKLLVRDLDALPACARALIDTIRQAGDAAGTDGRQAGTLATLAAVDGSMAAGA